MELAARPPEGIRADVSVIKRKVQLRTAVVLDPAYQHPPAQLHIIPRVCPR